MWTCPKCKREFKSTNQSHFCVKPENIEQYIAAQAEVVRPLLQQLHDVIIAAAPDITQKISQHMPTYWQKKNIVQFAAHKSHIGFYPGDEAVIEFAEKLTEYETNKGCIRLPLDKLLDENLISDIVKWKVDNITS